MAVENSSDGEPAKEAIVQEAEKIVEAVGDGRPSAPGQDTLGGTRCSPRK